MYGGIAVAKVLDEVATVVPVEPKDGYTQVLVHFDEPVEAAAGTAPAR